MPYRKNNDTDNMKKLIFAAALVVAACACTPKEESFQDIKDRVFALADTQFKLLATELAPDVFPVNPEADGMLTTDNVTTWVSGFYPGSLWLTYEQTGDEELLPLAERFTFALDSLVNYEPDHDHGFRINCSYGQAYRITGDERYLPMIRYGADALAARFNPVVGCTKSWNWGGGKWTYPVIIDNMMNLELLFNATKLFEDVDYTDISLTHARTTMRNHFRPDYSTWHLVDYSPEDGSVIGKQTVQGYADDSMWARGESWALYGYTMMYRETGETEFLEQACHIADLLLEKLPEDGVPYWDFGCVDIPDTYRDASAGCIMASAFLELSGLAGKPEYRAMAEKQIRTLASPEYLAAPGENHGFLLKHSVGHLPGDSQIDVPLTYADYYFLEALTRL